METNLISRRNFISPGLSFRRQYASVNHTACEANTRVAANYARPKMTSLQKNTL